MTAQRYQRPRLAWIKRRARGLAKGFGVSRREAVESAALDYQHFVGPARPTLAVILGGRS